MKRNLSKKEEDSAFRRKNRQDGNPDRKGKAINVATEKKRKKMKTFREFMYEEDNFGQAKKVMRKHSDRLKKLHRQIDKGSGSGEDVNEDKREEKARRSELAKKHGIDMTKLEHGQS